MPPDKPRRYTDEEIDDILDKSEKNKQFIDIYVSAVDALQQQVYDLLMEKKKWNDTTKKNSDS